MTIPRSLALAVILSALPAAIHAQERTQARGDTFFREMDTNGDGVISQEEFTLQKGVVFYLIDKNHDLKIEQTETKLTPDAFRQYAGTDGTIDGLDLFNMPGARFQAFDLNGDQKVTPAEFRQHLADIRSGPQTAEQR